MLQFVSFKYFIFNPRILVKAALNVFEHSMTDINRIVNFIYFINKTKMYFYLSNNEGIT